MTHPNQNDERLLRAMREAAAHLGAALAQTLPSDNDIIIGHVRDAHTELRAALREHDRQREIPIKVAAEYEHQPKRSAATTPSMALKDCEP